jgi:hypothetical protein
LEFRKQFVTKFGYLYSESNQESEDRNEKRLISDEQAFAEEFGWYPMLYVAAGEQYLNIDKVIESKAETFLTFMNFYKRKTELDTKRINNHKH